MRILRSLGKFLAVIAMALGVLLVASLAGSFAFDRSVPGRLDAVGNLDIHRLDPPADGAWRVALISDIQRGFAYVPEIMASIAEHEPQATILLGDMSSYGDAAHMGLVIRELAAAPSVGPLFAVPGNHDVAGPEDRELFLEHFGSTTFDVTIGSTRFLGIDNAEGGIDEAGLADLERHLDESARRGHRVVLCMHRPLLHARLLEEVRESFQALQSLVERYRVALVVAGHSHEDRDEIQAGTRYLVIPPGGDSSKDTGTNQISFIVLHGTDDIAVELVRFPRRNAVELKSRVDHVGLSHMVPMAEDSPLLFAALLAAGAVLCAGGWRAARARRA